MQGEYYYFPVAGRAVFFMSRIRNNNVDNLIDDFFSFVKGSSERNPFVELWWSPPRRMESVFTASRRAPYG